MPLVKQKLKAGAKPKPAAGRCHVAAKAAARVETWTADKLEVRHGDLLRSHMRSELPATLGHRALVIFLRLTTRAEVPDGTMRHWLSKQVTPDAARVASAAELHAKFADKALPLLVVRGSKMWYCGRTATGDLGLTRARDACE